MVRKDLKHGLETVLNLLLSGDTWGVDIVNPRTNLVGVAVMLEGIEQFHVALRSLDRDDISIQTLNGWEDIIEVGIAEVRMSLELVSNASSGQFERVHSPFEVSIPVAATEG